MSPLIVNGAPFCYDKPQPSGILADLADFLKEWHGPSPCMVLQTSGSTGTPKQLTVYKESMRASALATCHYFGLQAGDSALLCLPLRYIAGKMMVVRALVGGLNLVTAEPSSTPLAKLTNNIDFAPLVPMQVHSTLQLEDGMNQLEKARIILLGGGFVDEKLERLLQHCRSAVYVSYGMTETLSHVALRRLNGEQRSVNYTPLTGVSVSLSARGTLALRAPSIGVDYIETNDSAEIAPDGCFRILGRVDAVINSGGVKIQAEEIEQQILTATGLQVLAAPVPHPVLGQAVGLLWEGEDDKSEALQQAIDRLPRYHRPCMLVHHKLPRTATGKVNRQAGGAFLIDKIR